MSPQLQEQEACGGEFTLFCRKVSPSIVEPDLPCAMITIPIGRSELSTAAVWSSGDDRAFAEDCASTRE